MCIVGADPGERHPQGGRLEHVDGSIDLGDLELRFGGVPLLNDRLEATVAVAHDTSESGRIGEIRAEQGERVSRTLVAGDEAAQGRGVEQRNVGAQHNDVPGEALRQSGESELDCTTGAWRVVLIDDDHLRSLLRDDRRDRIPPVAHDDDNVHGAELLGRREHMGNERHPREVMQDLRAGRLHSRALARREDDDGER